MVDVVFNRRLVSLETGTLLIQDTCSLILDLSCLLHKFISYTIGPVLLNTIVPFSSTINLCTDRVDFFLLSLPVVS